MARIHAEDYSTSKRARQTNLPLIRLLGMSLVSAIVRNKADIRCHVLAHESFENEEIAKIMNEHFVNIKVDREERPDVDRMYMTFLQVCAQRDLTDGRLLPVEADGQCRYVS